MHRPDPFGLLYAQRKRDAHDWNINPWRRIVRDCGRIVGLWRQVMSLVHAIELYFLIGLAVTALLMIEICEGLTDEREMVLMYLLLAAIWPLWMMAYIRNGDWQ